MKDNNEDKSLMLELLKSLKSIAEGQTEILKELKATKPPGDLVPVRMPDGSTQLVPKSALVATTDANATNKMRVVESQPMTREPWPDPNIPKPPIQR